MKIDKLVVHRNALNAMLSKFYSITFTKRVLKVSKIQDLKLIATKLRGYKFLNISLPRNIFSQVTT